MNRSAWTTLGLAGLLCGCVPNNFVAPSADKLASKPLEPPPAGSRAPVTATQISADNAQEKAKALRAEMDRDLEQTLEANK
jgi:hypothetical protein